METLNNIYSSKKRHLKTFAKGSEICQYKIIDSPVGALTLLANSKALLSLMWGKDLSKLSENIIAGKQFNPVLETAGEQLREYFAGRRTTFNIPLSPKGSEFQKRVWRQLLKIPYGKPINYGEQARRLGQPKAARAVGGANGKNPIGIIIPCHRVIGASGRLTGFTGGLEIKRYLLELEGFSISE